MGAGAVSGHRVSPEDNSQLFHRSPASPLVSTTSRTHGSDVVRGGGGVPPSSRLSPRPAPPPEGSEAHSSTTQPRTGGNSTSLRRMPNKVVSCETCDNTFGFFKRKKICKDCLRCFCSTCLPKPPSSLRQNGRQCDKCTILISGKFTRQQLLAWRVKDMRCFLDVRNIPTSTCKEKHDLIDLLLLHFCLESNSVLREQREHDRLVGELADRMRSNSFYASPPTTTLPHQVPEEEPTSSPADDGAQDPPQDPTVRLTHNSTSPGTLPGAEQSQEASPNFATRHSSTADAGGTHAPPGGEGGSGGTTGVGVHMTEQLRERQLREMRETEHRLREELDQDEPETRPGIQRATIDDVQSADDAEKLTVRQLKEILANNFVDYRGCCEKHELVDRVKRLWNETQANKQRAAAAMADTTPTTAPSDPDNTAAPSATVEGTTSGPGGDDPEPDVCKICMDAAIDCILLECGHMVTCSKCGKRLADCPICRQYITRVVHVFRS